MSDDDLTTAYLAGYHKRDAEGEALREAAVVWRDSVTDPPTRHGVYVTDIGLAQWFVWTRTWVGPCEESQQTVLTPRVWAELPTPKEADRE